MTVMFVFIQSHKEEKALYLFRSPLAVKLDSCSSWDPLLQFTVSAAVIIPKQQQQLKKKEDSNLLVFWLSWLLIHLHNIKYLSI